MEGNNIMENKKINKIEVLIIGLALFATYFGAGNLIFPSMLGLESGNRWSTSVIAMILSGVVLPVLTIVIIGIKGSVQRITDHVNKKFYTIYVGIIMLFCCCVSIPRTAAVGIEMGLQGIWGKAPYILMVITYFAIAYFFSKDEGSVIDKIGKILTPVMTIILIILTIKGLIAPLGIPTEQSISNPFLHSFIGAYGTGDVLVSFLMANTFLSTIMNKGYVGSQVKKITLSAGIIAAILLGIVYGGLFYMGSCVSSKYLPSEISNADLLLTIIRSSGGQIAIYGLCISVILACLTTAIGQITAVANFFETETHGKVSYKILVPIVCIFVAFVASFGLDTIVLLTTPLFSLIYPIALVLMLLGIFSKFIPNDGGYKGGIYFTIIYVFLNFPSQYGIHINLIESIIKNIPLHNIGFGWLVPALVGAIIGIIVYNKKQ